MTAATYTILTKPQASAALALARAFGHEWGQGDLWGPAEAPYRIPAIPGTAGEPITATLDTAAIAEACRLAAIRDDNFLPIGIRPGLDEHGHLVHRTGTGRLEWAVDADGDVAIEICRPDGNGSKVVLSALVRPDEHGYYHAEVKGPHEPCHQRHLFALHDALVALCPRNVAFAACAPLWAEVEPDEVAA